MSAAPANESRSRVRFIVAPGPSSRGCYDVFEKQVPPGEVPGDRFKHYSSVQVPDIQGAPDQICCRVSMYPLEQQHSSSDISAE